MRATRILAITILLGAGSLPAAVQLAPANRAEPSVAASAGQQPADTALPLTLGDHCSIRRSWNGPPFKGVPFVRPPLQDLEACRVPRGLEHEVWLLDQSNTNGLTY